MSGTIIFGASGFVGTALRSLLDKKGVEYVAPSETEIDLRNFDSVEKISAIADDGDSLIMISAYTNEKGDPRALTMHNVAMAYHVLRGVDGIDIRHCVYLSSDSVYGKAQETIDHDTIISPDSLYGFMHAMRERYFTEHFLAENLTILRPSAIYGVGDTHNTYGINQFINEARYKQAITLFGEGEEFRSNIHVDDLAAIIYKALDERIPGAFVVNCGKSWDFASIAGMVAKNIEKNIFINHKPRTIPITHRFFYNSTLIEAFFEPRPADVGIKQVLAQLST